MWKQAPSRRRTCASARAARRRPGWTRACRRTSRISRLHPLAWWHSAAEHVARRDEQTAPLDDARNMQELLTQLGAQGVFALFSSGGSCTMNDGTSHKQGPGQHLSLLCALRYPCCAPATDRSLTYAGPFVMAVGGSTRANPGSQRA
ncbi:hypothetical protein BC834DRAFT_340884 [Gloeopeniophorella convolvens]|nr:hypothetical protein BC834DRAFT_340884 [Gloeopeniophorella convolvens]